MGLLHNSVLPKAKPEAGPKTRQLFFHVRAFRLER